MAFHSGRHFLQIPGPTNVPDRVLRAIDNPTIDHRGPEFAELGREVLEGLKPVFGTTQPVIIYPASGTGAWEAALVNTLSPGDRVLMFETGQFAALWRRLAERLGLEVDYVEGDWRHGVDPAQLEARLAEDRSHSIKAVCAVHNETSTGVTSDIAALSRRIITEFPEFYTYFAETEYTWNDITQQNRNPLLRLGIGADGLKTGHTNEAGYGLAGSAVQNGQRIVFVASGFESDGERRAGTEAMVKWAFGAFDKVKFFDAGAVAAEVDVWLGEAESVPLVAPELAQMLVLRGTPQVITVMLINQGLDGKVRFDDLSLKWADTGQAGFSDTTTLPLP